MIENKKILIVGANGFLASHLSKSLFNNHLYGLINENDERINYSLYKKIYTNIDSLFEEQKEFDHIYYLAAKIPYGNLNSPTKDILNTNISLLLKISEYYKNARIIYSSSVSVYGNPTSNLITLNSPYNNPTLYGLTKLSGENILKFHKSHAIIRFSSIFGIGCNEHTFIPKILNNALKHKKITIFGKGLREQNYILVEDAVQFLINAANHSENLTILGVASKSYSNIKIAKTISKKTNAIITKTNDIDNSPSMNYDGELSYKKIGYYPKRDIISYLENIIKND